jgi:hypothetical protein
VNALKILFWKDIMAAECSMAWIMTCVVEVKED